MDELHRRVTRRIRQLANDRKMALTHLADRGGVTRSHFWAVLAGTKSPTLRWLGKIAEALDVDPAELLVKPVKARR